MKKIEHCLLMRMVELLNVVLLTIPFAVGWFGYYAQKMNSPFYHYGNWAVVALFIIFYVVFARIYDVFKVSHKRILELNISQILAATISDIFLYLVICLLTKHLPNILPGIGTLIAQSMLAMIWSPLFYRWYFFIFKPKRSAIIYGRERRIENLFYEYGLERKFYIEKIASVKYCLEHLEILDSLETVFLSDLHSHDRNIILKYCVEHNVCTYVIPRVGDVIMSGAKKLHLFHLPMLQVGRYNPSLEYLCMKRLFDIVVSVITLIVFSPVFLVTAIAIRLYDGGPIFYKQCRLTKDGKKFDILKFRSMKVDAEKDGIARLSTGEKDERITPIGQVIRKYRIDELPQLINILTGELSICGPRPERPEIAEQYTKVIPEFRLRLQAKAGLTGYAQVYGKYNTTPYDKLQMDLMYISNPSFLEDLKIMFATVKILFMPESTEGVAEGTITAMSNRMAEEDRENANSETEFLTFSVKSEREKIG